MPAKMKAEQYCFEDFQSGSSSDEERHAFSTSGSRRNRFSFHRSTPALIARQTKPPSAASRVARDVTSPISLVDKDQHPNYQKRNRAHLRLNLNLVSPNLDRYDSSPMKSHNESHRIANGFHHRKVPQTSRYSNQYRSSDTKTYNDSDSIYSNTSNTNSAPSSNGDSRVNISLNRLMTSQSIPDITMGISSVFYDVDDVVGNPLRFESSDDDGSAGRASSFSSQRKNRPLRKQMSFSPIHEDRFNHGSHLSPDPCGAHPLSSDSGSNESTIYETISPGYSIQGSDKAHSFRSSDNNYSNNGSGTVYSMQGSDNPYSIQSSDNPYSIHNSDYVYSDISQCSCCHDGHQPFQGGFEDLLITTGNNKKELQRAKTLPIIDMPSILTREELIAYHQASLGVNSATTSSTPCTILLSSSSTPPSAKTSPAPDKRFAKRKLSYQESSYFRFTRSKDSKDKSISNKKSPRIRSQSETRQCLPTKGASPQPGTAWSFEDDRRLSVPCQDSKAITGSTTTQLFYTTPPRANMVRNSSAEKRLETSSSSNNLQRITRKLGSRERKELFCSPRTRSVSLDYGDTRTLNLFSATEANYLDVMNTIPASPSAPAFLAQRDSTQYSPKAMKELRVLANSQKKKSMSVDMQDSVTTAKRKSDKEKRSLYDVSALFDAVEQQDLDRVKVILDSCMVDINSLNGENMTVLDVAVMTNNIPIAKILLARGAKESPVFQRGDCRLQLLENLVVDAERRVVDLTAAVLNGSSGNANVSPAQLKENEKQLSHWEFRHRLLKRMKAGYDHARPPEPPSHVRLEVASNTSLLVKFDEPQSHNGAVVTRYKVEWSTVENFVPLSGEAVVEDLSCLEFEIRTLAKGSQYYVRVCAWNVKGYGSFSNSVPLAATPSSWRELDSAPSRIEGKLPSLHDLFHKIKKSRPPEASEMKDILNRGKDSPMQKKRVSIKNLFVSAPKFQKSIKRGLYMACLLYSTDDRVLVTSEDQLPIVEVDETFSGLTFQNDLYWLLKVACMWEDVKVLKQDMEKTSSASSTLRCKLLQAISSLQSGLGIQDLGQFYHSPIRDINGSIVFIVVNQVRDTKSVTLGSSKWVTLGKLARRHSLSSCELGDAQSLIVSTMPEIILYRQVSTRSLSKGLYLGYVKLQASVDVLRVMVPNKTPSCIPHVKIRDCPNVSRDEWEWLRNAEANKTSAPQSDCQENFYKLISDASKKLFTQLELPESSVSSHRIYDIEVLELSPLVSMILILPSMEDICIVPGHSDILAKRVDYTFLPVQVFESIHMNAYLPEFFSLYSQLSAFVEMDGVLAQQGHREAFSTEEISRAKEQLEVTIHLQQKLDKIWKCARWIRDITTYARNKEKKVGIQMQHIYYTATSISQSQGSAVDVKNNSTRTISNGVAAGSQSNGSANARLNVKNNGKERRIARFFDPNEENPHSTDSISIGGTYTRNNSVSSDSSLSPAPTQTSKSVPVTPVQHKSLMMHHGKISPSSSLSSLSTTASSSSSSSSNLTCNDPSWGIVKVHAMYETGLSKNVNMKLHITEQTTSRDIINLVVRHLNSLAADKSRNMIVYPEDQLSQFCVLLQCKEQRKVLNDDFKLLQLRGHLQKTKICVTRLEQNVVHISQQSRPPREVSQPEEFSDEYDLIHGRATLV